MKHYKTLMLAFIAFGPFNCSSDDETLEGATVRIAGDIAASTPITQEITATIDFNALRAKPEYINGGSVDDVVRLDPTIENEDFISTVLAGDRLRILLSVENAPAGLSVFLRDILGKTPQDVAIMEVISS
ncbi:MAG: hypothetical protein WBA16_04770 [Nonlabens sp.]